MELEWPFRRLQTVAQLISGELACARNRTEIHISRVRWNRLFWCSHEHLFLVSSTSSPPMYVCINFPRFFSRAHQPGRRRGNENMSANADDDDSWTSSDQRTGLRCSFLRFHEARALLFNDRQQQFVFLSILPREPEETRIYAPGIITLRLNLPFRFLWNVF